MHRRERPTGRRIHYRPLRSIPPRRHRRHPHQRRWVLGPGVVVPERDHRGGAGGPPRGLGSLLIISHSPGPGAL
jgi:hypothetical protein